MLRFSPTRALTCESLRIVFVNLEPPWKLFAFRDSLWKLQFVQLLFVIMNKLQKHVLHHGDTPTLHRIGHPTIDAVGLVKWLNIDRSGTSFNRVVAMTKELKNCNSLAREFSERRIRSGVDDDTREKARAVSESHRRLNSLLKDVAVCPMIFPPVGIGRWVAATWIPVKDGKPLTITPGIGRCAGLAAALDELNAVLTVLTLANCGGIDRIRQCDQCGRWLYARRIQQRFCSQSCQQRNYKDSETWKTDRRDYMRRYRLGLREMEMAALKSARS